MLEKVEKLFQAASAGDKAELVTYHNANLDRMKAYQKSPTAAHKKDWDAARAGLQECVDSLWPRYFPEESAAADPRSFSRQKDALGWLHDKGYKVSAGKFSNDWNNGKVKVHQGAVTLSNLMAYAAGLDVDHKKVASAEQRAARKDDLDIRLKEEQLRKIANENRKEDARWILKDEATDQSAALVVVLRNNLRHHASLQTPALILAAGGDTSRALEVEAVQMEIIAAGFNELAASREARLIGLVDGAAEEDDE